MALEPARDALPRGDAGPPLWRRLLARVWGKVREPEAAPTLTLASVMAAAGISREAAAAGGIGLAALLLALAAADGDVEFPGPGFEARLMSRPPLPSAKASEATARPATLPAGALAERLVENPTFDGPLPAHASDSAQPDTGRPPPDQTLEAKAAGSEDAAAVLSAASPPPADPALRLQERQRSLAGRGPSEAAPQPAYAVQLLAVSRRDQAAQAWSRLHRDHADLLGPLQPIIVEPEQQVSTLFRLRAGPMASAGEAQSVCASLTRRGVDCIVVHRGG